MAEFSGLKTWGRLKNGDILSFQKCKLGNIFHSLGVANFDNDGDVDVFSGGGPLSNNEIEMHIWENKNDNGSLWVEHPLFKGKMCHEAIAGDVDGDGDIDTCTKPCKGDNLHLFLENRLIIREK